MTEDTPTTTADTESRAPENQSTPTSRWISYFQLLRVHQWTKNGFCLAGVFFSGRFTDPMAIQGALLAFGLFCLASPAVYIFNDLLDRDRDRRHAKKRHRPIASGEVNALTAGLLAGGLALAALAGGLAFNSFVFGCLVLYLVNNLAYTLVLKHVPILDVLSISFSFVIRLLAGVYAVAELPTTWITLCTFFLSLFLAFGKRRGELAGLMETDAADQRPVLSHYSLPYLDSMVNSSAIMAVMCYALFTTSDKNPSLVVTVPIVFFGIMHYKRLLMLTQSGEEPDRIVLRDVWIQATVVIWLIVYSIIIYGDVQLFRLPSREPVTPTSAVRQSQHHAQPEPGRRWQPPTDLATGSN